MISLLMFLAIVLGDPGPPGTIAITCRIDVVEIGYYGVHDRLQPTPPRRRSSQIDYLLDFDRPSLTMESPGHRMVTTDDPVQGSHLVAGANGIDVETTVAMTGGFVLKRVSHFNRDGSGGSTKQGTFSQGAIVRHEEGTLTCRPRA